MQTTIKNLMMVRFIMKYLLSDLIVPHRVIGSPHLLSLSRLISLLKESDDLL
jgi:hypothetical protein